MPQLNPEFWISQIFWLILTFGTMYVVLSKFIQWSINLIQNTNWSRENLKF
ncbi:hypothetical protein OA868_03430 [Candidatus Pelagibacter sp.]|nr:hypothetical protein [Candidatus Pelagibacter sp.]